MKRFDISIFINNLGEDLVTIFNRSSREGIHPDEIGKTKEINIARQIEALLPKGVGIGRGFVIDSKDNISSQCDLIIYEKDLIPVFIKDSNEDYSYFPCEGVIAVGEIKSTLNINELQTSMQKLNKIKLMQRPYTDSKSYRHYLHTFTTYGSESERFDPIEKSFDNIFTFIFCKDNLIAEQTLLEKLYIEYNECMELGIDRIFSINKNTVAKFGSFESGNYLWCDKKANGFSSLLVESMPFGFLINDLSNFIKNGRTQPFILENYYKMGAIKLGKNIIKKV